MPYPVHPDIEFSKESPGVETDYRVLKSEFGDGFAQITVDGINSQMDVWNLTLANEFRANVQILKSFLDERAGLPFSWTPPGETSAKLWTSDAIGRSNLGTNHEDASVTYTEWFGADES